MSEGDDIQISGSVSSLLAVILTFILVTVFIVRSAVILGEIRSLEHENDDTYHPLYNMTGK